MKRILLGLIALLIVAGPMLAQEKIDIKPEKAVKKAGRALSSYNLDPRNNKDKLMEAKRYIEYAIQSDEMSKSFDAWQERGNVFNTIASDETSKLAQAQLTNTEYKIKDYQTPLIAFESLQKALKYAEKRYETKAAIEGLQLTLAHLNTYANEKLLQNDYAGAYPLLEGVLDVRNILVANGKDKVFEKESDLDNHKYVTGFCAYEAGKTDRAKELFNELYQKGYDEPRVYSMYVKMLLEEDDPDAIKVLETAREKYPDNSDILFAEINYYIRSEKYDILEEKLKKAIAKEPDNPSVYAALGNVYMNLYTASLQADQEEKAEEYFQQSLEYYNKALEIKPDLFDAIYSVGSVYFNRAVEMLKAMNELGISKAEQKQYNAMSKEVDELFKKALPYFQKAEQLDPNDRNTLIALKEIYARQNDFEKSNEFKRRLDVVTQGGKNETPYFKE